MTKAQFIVLKDNRILPVHFNPSEYQITQIAPESGGTLLTSDKKERLSFTLHFDTFMSDLTLIKEDVRLYTEPIANLSAQAYGSKQLVSFVWGSLDFVGVIESVSQRFTMFTEDGKPVRAVLDIVMVGTEKNKFEGETTLTAFNWSDNSWKAALVVPNPRLLL